MQKLESLGVGHADELSYLFNLASPQAPLPMLKDLRAEEDLAFSRALVKVITSFADSGFGQYCNLT